MGLSREVIEARLARARELMRGAGIDTLVIGPSADFQYFTGHLPMTSERLNALVISGDEPATIVVPRLEAPRIADLESEFDFAVWDEVERPTTRIAALARSGDSQTVAVNDQLWSGFLLQLEELLPDASFVSGSAVLSRLRITKDAAELDLLREASRRTDAAWEEFVASAHLIGMTERQVSERISRLLLEHGLESVAFAIAASGPNAASPHHSASDRLIEPGDPVIMDFGGSYQGYYSDITRTPIAGEPAPELAKIYQIVLEAQQAAFAAIKPGVPCQEIDRAARKVIRDAGYGDFFIHRVGHGLGSTVHEEPYLVEGNTLPLEPGMVVSDEPGIYVAGKWGVRIEDSVAVTDSGAERLNHVSRELLSLP